MKARMGQPEQDPKDNYGKDNAIIECFKISWRSVQRRCVVNKLLDCTAGALHSKESSEIKQAITDYTTKALNHLVVSEIKAGSHLLI